MNENPIKPTNVLNPQERKFFVQKLLLPNMTILIIGISGLVLAFLSFTLDVSHTASIAMMTAFGLCGGIAIALSLRVNLQTIQMQRSKDDPAKYLALKYMPKENLLSIAVSTFGKGDPAKEQQILNNLSKKKWLPAAIIFIFTALMFIASLLIFLLA